MDDDALAINVMTPLGLRVVCSSEYWRIVTAIKHPAMKDRKGDVELALSDPDEIRRSIKDPEVILFHRQIPPRWICAVVKRVNGLGYLITAYPADKIKQGDVIWRR